MDEATPHLHIDFIPFTTGSKRGLETIVSLKSALAQQGITGGTKHDTEWNQFVNGQKLQLAIIMERHGVAWKKLGTHEKRLSVLDYEKIMRTREVAELTAQIEFLHNSKDELEEKSPKRKISTTILPAKSKICQQYRMSWKQRYTNIMFHPNGRFRSRNR